MSFGDTVEMAATASDGSTPFGVIAQRVVPGGAGTKGLR